MTPVHFEKRKNPLWVGFFGFFVKKPGWVGLFQKKWVFLPTLHGAPREVVSESAGSDIVVPLADVWHPRNAETGSVPAF